MRAASLQQLCNSCARLAGLVWCFIACFILLVIAPLQSVVFFQLMSARSAVVISSACALYSLVNCLFHEWEQTAVTIVSLSTDHESGTVCHLNCELLTSLWPRSDIDWKLLCLICNCHELWTLGHLWRFFLRTCALYRPWPPGCLYPHLGLVAKALFQAALGVPFSFSASCKFSLQL